MKLALTVLLTGLSVVFLVLIVLILSIKLYGTIISKIQNRISKAKVTSNKAIPSFNHDGDYIDDEIIAVISAAVAATYCNDTKYEIKSIKRVFNSRPAWGNASVIENTKPF